MFSMLKTCYDNIACFQHIELHFFSLYTQEVEQRKLTFFPNKQILLLATEQKCKCLFMYWQSFAAREHVRVSFLHVNFFYGKEVKINSLKRPFMHELVTVSRFLLVTMTRKTSEWCHVKRLVVLRLMAL